MVRIRVVDYVANPGGGIRFGVELLKGFQAHGWANVEFVSHAAALQRYRCVFERERVGVKTLDVRPRLYWQTLPAARVWKIPGTVRLKRFLGYGTRLDYEVPASVLRSCDVALFPWLLYHRIPQAHSGKAVGVLHDVIIFLWPGLVPELVLRNEQQTIAHWVRSQAQVVVGSRVTMTAIAELFHVPEARIAIIPPWGAHMDGAADVIPQPEWHWSTGRFLLCPANTSPHKNHEVLLAGVTRWGAKVPLVLTGHGSDLNTDNIRGRRLRTLAEEAGLHVGETLIPLGYVSNETYGVLLRRAWATIMPSVMEGGGSFPVWEAMLSGVPVVCSDIPVMREQLEQTGGSVLWFDPHDPEDLAAKLRDLYERYDVYKARALTQVMQMRVRSWKDVAADYWSLVQSARRAR